jgi:hypothetical protein
VAQSPSKTHVVARASGHVGLRRRGIDTVGVASHP